MSGAQPAALGRIFFGATILAGISALAAAWVAARIGLVNTMVVTHLPSNLLLMLVPLMPNLPLAIVVLFMRFSILQMDVPPSTFLHDGGGRARRTLCRRRCDRDRQIDRRGDFSDLRWKDFAEFLKVEVPNRGCNRKNR
jgi:hypothetical protein